VGAFTLVIRVAPPVNINAVSFL